MLALQEKPLDLLFYYCLKWNLFSHSMQEVEQYLESYQETVRLLYSKAVPSFYPRNPSFSIFRLMTRLWARRIYHPFSQQLSSAFLSTTCLSSSIILISSRRPAIILSTVS